MYTLEMYTEMHIEKHLRKSDHFTSDHGKRQNKNRALWQRLISSCLKKEWVHV